MQTRRNFIQRFAVATGASMVPFSGSHVTGIGTEPKGDLRIAPEQPTGRAFNSQYTGQHPAADGQLGGIIKVYREWRISGDQDWLGKLCPEVKASMDFCIAQWDPRHKGIIEEPHHNTYDIEFWGPNGMCTSFYLGALAAFMELCRAMSPAIHSCRHSPGYGMMPWRGPFLSIPGSGMISHVSFRRKPVLA